jgi:hypothetical protein
MGHDVAGAPNLPPSNQASTQRQEFAANDFDPSGFYGEDYEEEEQDEVGEIVKKRNLHDGFTNQPPTSIANPVDRFVAQPHEQQQLLHNTGECLQSGTLTTAELLDLFGGNDSSQQTTESANIVGTTESADTVKDDEPTSDSHDILTLPPPSDSSSDEEEED